MVAFRVHYKTHYMEHDDQAHRDIQAVSARGALQRFLAQVREYLTGPHQVDDGDFDDLRRVSVNGAYAWWEGDWLQVYQGIERIDEGPCPMCEGTGAVPASASAA